VEPLAADSQQQLVFVSDSSSNKPVSLGHVSREQTLRPKFMLHQSFRFRPSPIECRNPFFPTFPHRPTDINLSRHVVIKNFVPLQMLCMRVAEVKDEFRERFVSLVIILFATSVVSL
jgi:hypothetical protein